MQHLERQRRTAIKEEGNVFLHGVLICTYTLPNIGLYLTFMSTVKQELDLC